MASTSSTAATTNAARSVGFERFAGIGALVTGISSLLYAVFFLAITGVLHQYVPSVLLGVGGVLATAVVVALYRRVRAVNADFALWALALGLLGQMGAAIHGVDGLASVISRSPAAGVGTTLPNAVDPAGFLAFGVTGVSTFVFAWLILHGGQLPRGLGYLGYALAVLLVALFLGALLSNDTKSLWVLLPGGLASVIATPVWNLWLGLLFLRRRSV
jgi:hypothetical protein